MDIGIIQEAFFASGNSLNFVDQGFWDEFPALTLGPFLAAPLDLTAELQSRFEPLMSNLNQFIQTLQQQVDELATDFVEELGTVVSAFEQQFEFVKTLIEYDFYLT